ncbi:LacI family DNA-binding transcriptional regulator [Terriglobus aquaticus]|uniref:LacI family DNA-binding transcriptional regulator n=1 Tax=Terriglobus aquaticus TaxID=940139 RepID=A0ABW9KJH6_9BACT|nr:LacI family DNA-binding transcriptional regulator [Terriglobus aquaticus]
MKPKRSVPALMDVARRAGVGAATVSRVINGGQNVSARRLAAVQQAIEELGYHPNQAARSLKGARTKTIGLVVPSVADPFFSAAAEAIQEVARGHGTLLLLAVSENQSAREQEQVASLIQRRIDGLILAPSDGADFSMFKHAGFPVVCFDRPFPGQDIPVVLSDNYAGAKAATEHLVKAGRKRILCLSGDPQLFTSKRRVKGYRDVVRAAGLPYLAEVSVQDHESAVAALTPYLSGRSRIDAVFSIKNAITVSAYKILRDAGLEVPKMVAIAAYDDFELADTLDPPICVVRQPVVGIARRAAEMLFEALDRGQVQTKMVKMEVELIHRASCGGHSR